MNRKAALSLVALAIASTVGCSRIETGEVGVRIGWDKQLKSGELLPGSFNQTIVGDIITFPVKDVAIDVNDIPVIAKDNSTMSDFDMTLIYNINPSMVSELYGTKSKSFHSVANGDTYLMLNYIAQLARNAAYKAARSYDALDMNDNRQTMEQAIRDAVTDKLKEEKLEGSITINQVQIRKILPAQAVIDSANALVRAKNEQKQKEVEVKTAEAEARRMQALANQGSASIAYMQAKAQADIAEGIKNGKVNTVVIPFDFKGMINVGK